MWLEQITILFADFQTNELWRRSVDWPDIVSQSTISTVGVISSVIELRNLSFKNFYKINLRLVFLADAKNANEGMIENQFASN